MNKILVSQRVDIIPAYQERRDAIDQRWTEFLMAIGLLPIFVSNNIDHAQSLVQEISCTGILLTGGNDLSRYGGDTKERDAVEHFLIDYAMTHKIPLGGICHGMQVIQAYFSTPLRQVNNRINVEVPLILNSESRYNQFFSELKQVKTYYQWASTEVAQDFLISIQDHEGYVMAIEHCQLPIWGQMWHPERSEPFAITDQKFFQKFFEVL